jgi:tRNA(Ile)-lysidine synthase
MLLEFEKKVADFVKANRLFESTDRIVLALSGGADSTALLYAMVSLKKEGILSADIICAHINHQLRGADANVDEDFAVARARDLNLAITTKRVDVRGFAHNNKLSIETAARQLRVETLLDVAKKNNCTLIATAHHKNDNAETILQRLVRGTGFRGLAGIWPTRIFADDIRFARPLLCISRDEVIEYLQKRNLKWRTDHTNADCTYTRNFIRHRLLPSLQQDCTGSVVEQLSELAASARKLYSLVCNCAEKVWPELTDCSNNEIKLNLKIFLAQPPPLNVELVRRSLTAVGSGQRDVTKEHFERIFHLAEQNVTGRKIELPSGFIIRREYDYIVFARHEKSSTSDEPINKSINVQIPGQTGFDKYVIEATALEVEDCRIEKFKTEKTNFVEWFDLEKLKLPLEVRFRNPGDRFWPLGLKAEKKIGKFLTAAKVPHHLRRKLLIVADSEKIIWLWPIRISEQTRVTKKTKKILQLQITETNNVEQKAVIRKRSK